LSGASTLREDPIDPNTLYAAGDVYSGGQYKYVVYKSTDAGATWPTMYTVNNIGQYAYNYSFDVAPSDPAIMYIGGYEDFKVKIYRTGDGGANWADVTGNLQSLHQQYDYVQVLWVSPDDPDIVLAGTQKGVFKTTDGGANWSATPLDTDTNDMVYHAGMETLFAGTGGGGVLKTVDQGNTWEAMNDGLGGMSIACLGIDKKNGYLYAGTSGDSTWRVSLDGTALFVDVTEISESTGGVANFSLNATAANGDRNYLLLGSVTGTDPGTPLPGGMATLPLNWDVMTNVVLSLLNTPMFDDFMGKLDSEGTATATWDTFGPLPSGSAGVTVHFAYALNGPWNFASNAVGIDIVP
jgi:photosystem II stability/assembly factor-like uncharacterized protein